MLNMLGAAMLSLKLKTMQEYFSHLHDKEEVLIIDEFDHLISQFPYTISERQVVGLWCLKNKKLIGLTGTLNIAIQRFLG
jgi:hypothetical protein